MGKIDASKIFSVCVAATLFLLLGTSYAQLTDPDLPDRTGIKTISNVTLHSAFKTQEQLDTNIFLQNTNEGFQSDN